MHRNLFCFASYQGRRLNITQDLIVGSSNIHDLWRARKMSTEVAREELLISRARGARRLIEEIDFHCTAENTTVTEALARSQRDRIEKIQSKFRDHEAVREFLQQFTRANMDVAMRFSSLLLLGETKSGKSKKGESLFGPECTLVVNCQGVSPALPSIRSFDRSRHVAILWDEIDEAQVLNNKLTFQAGTHPVTLGQSACGVFAYSKYLFGTAMILCSNTFSFTQSKGKPLCEEDSKFLKGNILKAELESGQRWYLEDDAVILPICRDTSSSVRAPELPEEE